MKRVVKSTLAAECLTELEWAEVAFFIKSVLCDILQLSSESQVLPIFRVTDNQSSFDSVHYYMTNSYRPGIKKFDWLKAGL